MARMGKLDPVIGREEEITENPTNTIPKDKKQPYFNW